MKTKYIILTIFFVLLVSSIAFADLDAEAVAKVKELNRLIFHNTCVSFSGNQLLCCQDRRLLL